MSTLLYKMIREGEHQQQDFKFCINDSKKIARSLVAFANTDGGRLLIGVKDNGRIAGVSSDEEYYMVESAAKIYSRPAILFSTRQHQAEGKTVLEIVVEPSISKPHCAQDDQGRWMAYFRLHDENRLANKIMLEVWKKKAAKHGVLLNYSESEKCLLEYLDNNRVVSVSKFARLAHISFREAEQIIIRFLVIDILQFDFTGESINYRLNEEFDRGGWGQSGIKSATI